MLHTVFSVDNSAYLHWQTELLAYSMQQVQQPGALTRLFSSSEPMSVFRAGYTFQTDSYTHFHGDNYSPRNRVMALLDWLSAGLPEEESVLLIDPDCVFLSPLDEEVERGLPIAQDIPYMSPYQANNLALIQRHGFRPERIQGMGIPLIIHREDLRALLPLWRSYLEAIRRDPVSLEYLGGGWTTEMWGYVFAASKLELWHEIRQLAQFQDQDRDDLPLVHYCYDSKLPENEWQWSKRTYHAWQPVEMPAAGGVPRASVALLDLLNRYIEERKHTHAWN